MNSQTAILMEQCKPHLLGLALTEPIAQGLAGEAVERYNEPWRKHHTVKHLGDVVGFLVEHVKHLENPRRTLWAAIDHDILYVPWLLTPGINEELSAQLNRQRLLPYLADEEVASSGKYIRATADHKWDGEDTDLAYLLDADLKILGAPTDEFEAYDENTQREYRFLDQALYKTGRTDILKGFHEQDRLYITDVAHSRFEDQAKANLESKLGELTRLG